MAPGKGRFMFAAAFEAGFFSSVEPRLLSEDLLTSSTVLVSVLVLEFLANSASGAGGAFRNSSLISCPDSLSSFIRPVAESAVAVLSPTVKPIWGGAGKSRRT